MGFTIGGVRSYSVKRVVGRRGLSHKGGEHSEEGVRVQSIGLGEEHTKVRDMVRGGSYNIWLQL